MANYTIGLDLGQARDYTAAVIVERLHTVTNELRERADGTSYYVTQDHWHVRHIQRFDLGTPYPAVVAQIGELLSRKELRYSTVLRIDATGVGRAVMDMFRETYLNEKMGDFRPQPITISAGSSRSGNSVPKTDLVAGIQIPLQEGPLKISEDIPLADKLRQELSDFRVKISASGNDMYEAVRESAHDDLVLALAMAVFRIHRKSEPRRICDDGEIIDPTHMYSSVLMNAF